MAGNNHGGNIQRWKAFLFPRKRFNVAETRFLVRQLKINCAVFLDPTIRSTNIRGPKALKVLGNIVKHSNRFVVQRIPEWRSLLECALVLVQNYVAHLRMQRTIAQRLLGRSQPYQDAKRLFQATINLMLPEMQELVIETILCFLKREALWKVEFICVEMLTAVLDCDDPPCSLLLRTVIDEVEKFLAYDAVTESRNVILVLQTILKTSVDRWQSLAFSDIAKLVRFYHSCAIVGAGTKRNQIYELRLGFEKCIKNVLKLVSPNDLRSCFILLLPLNFDTGLSNEAMLEFGTTVEYAASRMQIADSDSQTGNVLGHMYEYLLQYVASEWQTQSVLACMVFIKLLSCTGTVIVEFNSPKVFHINTYYDLPSLHRGATTHQQAALFEQHRESFEQSIMTAVQLHSDRTTNVEVIHSVLCTVLVEAPCAFTATAIACLVLKIQKLALTMAAGSSDLDERLVSNRLHALVISVLTLINWIHRGFSLHTYINRVLNRRFDLAPHLNPPLKELYQYASHHISWDHEALYFDPLEIRYGLWKCFRIGESRIPLPPKLLAMRRRHQLSNATVTRNTVVRGKDLKQKRDPRLTSVELADFGN